MLAPGHPLRKAAWMWPVSNFLFNQYACFRADFSLRSVPDCAPFFVSADQLFKLWVNGHYIGRGPARGFQISWPFDEFDLAPCLRRKHNWIAIEAYNPGISTFQYVHQGYAGVICGARWGTFELLSGENWLARVDPSRAAWTARLSRQISFQEHVDARLANRDWICREAPPSGWGSGIAGRRRVYGALPWHSMEPRGTAVPQGGLRDFKGAVSIAAGRCNPGYADALDTVAGFCDEIPTLRWQPSGAMEASGVPPAGKGRLRAVVLDMGEPTVASLVVDIAGSRGGEVVDFLFTEIVKELKPLVLKPEETNSRIAMLHRLRLRRGTTRHEFFHLMGFRYVTVIVRDSTTPLRLRIRARECLYPLEIQGRFRSSDARLNDIWKICRRTQQVCSLDTYVDTPWREQTQWWGDARVQAANTFHLAADARLLRRGIQQIGAQETPNGLTYSHAPTMSHQTIIPDFSLTWLLTIYDYYWQTGDISLVAEQWERIKRLLNYFGTESSDRDGLLRYDPRYWLFLDWAPLHRTGTPTPLSLWYLLALEKLADLLIIAGMSQEATSIKRRHSGLRRSVLRKLWDAGAGMFIDGLDEHGRRAATHSIHTQVLGILCGLKPGGHRRIAEALLLPHLQGKVVLGPSPSSYWIHYEFLAMRDLGYDKAVIECIRRKWAEMVPYGGTFECFAPKFAEESVTHAWAAHPLVHLSAILGGVVQAAPAWRKIRFRPLLTADVTSAEVTVPTPHGPIHAEWRKSRGQAEVRLALPKHISAQVELPGIIEKTSRGGKWTVRERSCKL